MIPNTVIRQNLREASEANGGGGYEEIASKLQTSAEGNSQTGDVFGAVWLQQSFETLFADEPAIAEFLGDNDERRRFLHTAGTLPLTSLLASKLEFARDERPEVLNHSLKVACCAGALAHHCGHPHHEVANAAAGGLFHDLGLLHVDPQLLKDRCSLEEHERHYLYSHPLTSYLFLEKSHIWHPVVSTAVLEHHERLDGSGYPQGMAGNKLGLPGQLLAVAELGATLLSYSGKQACRDRLEVILTMNQGKLNLEYASHLLAIFPRSGSATESRPPPEHLLDTLVDLSVVIQRWRVIAGQVARSPLVEFVDERMSRLTHNLAYIGIDLDQWTTFFSDEAFDTRTGAEIQAAGQEGIWQLHAIADELRRRSEQLVAGSKSTLAAVDGWLASIDALQRH